MTWIHHFGDAESAQGSSSHPTADRALLGGKGAGLVEMTRLGGPVPAGFTVTTDACRAYLESNEIPPGLWDDVRRAIGRVEEVQGRAFGSTSEPLLLSVRSGAPFSMPGMMDTILNLGLNDETTEGLARSTGDERFARDCHRRLLQMYGDVVMGLHTETFEELLEARREEAGAAKDSDLSAAALGKVVEDFKTHIQRETGAPFPEDPWDQLFGGIEAVFSSWNTPRAASYRRVHRLPEDAGTAANVQAMVFGNLGENCATGVCFSRNPSTGEPELYGEFLENAQGEDVVAGIRDPEPIALLREQFPEAYDQLLDTTHRVEAFYRDMQDMEFTIERGTLYLLQTRAGKRSAQSAVRIALDMLDEGILEDEGEALLRVPPAQIEQLLHPMIDPDADVAEDGTGLPGSPGAVSGRVVFDPDTAEEQGAQEPVILVRRETSPDDFHGMATSVGILTARGGMTSHAAVVARGMGKPAVVGLEALELAGSDGARIGERAFQEGDWLTLDGATGRVFLGRVPTVEAKPDERFNRLMEMADRHRRLGVRANADTPEDAAEARKRGARGIGLCRTEHMFFGEERTQAMRRMILAGSEEERREALSVLLPYQREDFLAIFREMDGMPVTIRLLDPPLHEFLPNDGKAIEELARSMDMDPRQVERAVEMLTETNPMLGHRGVRLGMTYPEVTEMQARAIFQAAADAREQGYDPHPEVMIPLAMEAEELRRQAELVREVAREVLEERNLEVAYQVGTMIELPRAALTADRLSEHAEFFSFGTNDLTQTTLGLSRDDSGGFLPQYVEEGVLQDDPFQTLDVEGVGALIEEGVRKGRGGRPDLGVGICGEHGGDPQSVFFCEKQGMDYVSCSPFRVPVARLAAAHAVLRRNQE